MNKNYGNVVRRCGYDVIRRCGYEGWLEVLVRDMECLNQKLWMIFLMCAGQSASPVSRLDLPQLEPT